MIASLRRLHRTVFLVAALLVPLLLFLALRTRRPMPVDEPLPAELAVPQRTAVGETP